MTTTRVVHDPDALAAFAGCAFVPTMGALHGGHASLVRAAAATGKPVVVSVFVNPTQFAPHEDFAKYPRTLDDDVARCQCAGAAVVFAPTVEAIYPRGMAQTHDEAHAMALPRVATQPHLEDASRPGHFAGVCQVVARLFDLTRPSVAVFGEKDYQQLRVISEMVAAECSRWGALRIAAGPTVRESTGLAMSSRNRYLTADQRDAALGIVRALHAATTADHPGIAETVMHGVLEEHGLEVEYAVIRDASTLLPVQDFAAPARALIAARLGTTRLIDNMLMPLRD